MANFLHDELWQYIGFKLPAADRILFRAVCKTWMSLLPSRRPPCLLLAAADPSLLTRAPPPRFLAPLGEKKTYKINFPEIHRARCVGSTGSWLITAHDDDSIRLVHPFRRHQIHLPSQLTFDNGIDNDGCHALAQIQLWKVILSSSPDEGDCIAMAIHNEEKILAIARPGDAKAKWTTVEIADKPAPYEVNVELAGSFITLDVYVQVDDAVFYKGQFYAVTNCGQLLVCDIGDIGDGRNPPTASYLNAPLEKFSVFRINYLVEWLGELLLAVKCVDMIEDGFKYKTSKFELYKFDFANRKWNAMRSLGEHSLFLGFNTSVSVRASDYYGLVKKNCVYFTDDFLFGYRDMRLIFETKGGEDMGVFDLEDDSIKPHFTGKSTSSYSPPVWIVE